jgi:hypothetical protein
VTSRPSACANRICFATNSAAGLRLCSSAANFSESGPAISPSEKSSMSISSRSEVTPASDGRPLPTRPPILPPPPSTCSIRLASTVADRVIKPIFKANGLKWKGWHAYRRGLATNLQEIGVPDIVIQAILRHEDIRTTQRSYIKIVPRVVTAAMKRLESQVACTADATKQFGKLKKANPKPT